MFIKKRNCCVSLSYLIMCLFLHTLLCFIIYSSRMAQTTHGSRIGFSFTRRESETLSFWRAWVFTMTGYLLWKHCNSKPHSKLSRNATASAVCRPQTAHSEWNGSFHHWNTAELYQTLKQRHKFIMRVFERLKLENKTFYDLCFNEIFILRGNLFISGEVPTVPETGQAIPEKLKFCFSKKSKLFCSTHVSDLTVVGLWVLHSAWSKKKEDPQMKPYQELLCKQQESYIFYRNHFQSVTCYTLFYYIVLQQMKQTAVTECMYSQFVIYFLVYSNSGLYCPFRPECRITSENKSKTCHCASFAGD